MNKKINYRDLGTGLFFMIFAIVMYQQSYNIVITVHDAMGPRFFPQLVSILMGILSIILIISSFKSSLEPGKKFENKSSLLTTIIILILYALFLEKIGFIILTTIYLFFQIILLLPKEYIKNRKYLLITGAVSIITPIFLYFLFYKVFSIFLPAGILG